MSSSRKSPPDSAASPDEAKRDRESARAADKADPKGGSRWAPIVVFGGILAIGLTSVLVVLISNCNRDEPYLDPVKLPFDPDTVKPIPKPKRPIRPNLDLFN